MMAHSENADTVKSDTLNEVVVNAELQRTSTNVTTYIPTEKNKKSDELFWHQITKCFPYSAEYAGIWGVSVYTFFIIAGSFACPNWFIVSVQ